MKMEAKQRGRTAQDRKGHIAPPVSKSEAKTQHEASCQSCMDGVRQMGSGVATLKNNVCTYYTQTLKTDDDTNRLVEELGNIKWHAVGLCETNKEDLKGLENFQGSHGCAK